jgi:hypothetical protein
LPCRATCHRVPRGPLSAETPRLEARRSPCAPDAGALDARFVVASTHRRSIARLREVTRRLESFVEPALHHGHGLRLTGCRTEVGVHRAPDVIKPAIAWVRGLLRDRSAKTPPAPASRTREYRSERRDPNRGRDRSAKTPPAPASRTREYRSERRDPNRARDRSAKTPPAPASEPGSTGPNDAIRIACTARRCLLCRTGTVKMRPWTFRRPPEGSAGSPTGRRRLLGSAPMPKTTRNCARRRHSSSCSPSWSCRFPSCGAVSISDSVRRSAWFRSRTSPCRSPRWSSSREPDASGFSWSRNSSTSC